MVAWAGSIYSSVKRHRIANVLPAVLAGCLACAPATRAGEVLFVVAYDGMTSADSVMRGLAAELGHSVTVVTSQSMQMSQTTGKVLVMISRSAGYWSAPPELKSLNIPIVSWSMIDWGHLAMIQSGAGYFTQQGRTDLSIVMPEHPMAAGLSGTVEVCTAPSGMEFGYPPAGGLVVAVEPGTNHPALFGFELGAAMRDGFLAPARRVGFFVSNDAATALSAHGRAVVKAALGWSLSNNPPNILSHPLSQTLKERQSAYFTVSGNGVQPLSYQWLKNGSPISGATQPYYSTPGSTLADNGAAFRCIVSNAAGSDTTDPGVLTVLARGTPVSSDLVSVAGELTSAAGLPLGANGQSVNRDITVKVFTAVTGGTLIHQEAFLAANNQAVQVKDGRFVLRLGLGASQTEFQDILSVHPDLYAEFHVGAEGGTEEVLSPRIPVTSPALAGTPRMTRGAGVPTATAQIGTLYQDQTNNSVWVRVAHSWVRISN